MGMNERPQKTETREARRERARERERGKCRKEHITVRKMAYRSYSTNALMAKAFIIPSLKERKRDCNCVCVCVSVYALL